VVALWSGVAPILGEHRYGTFHQDRATLPTALVWRAKAGVALLVALVGGAVLPIALAKAGNTAAGWRDLGLWALLVAMATGVGLVASALLRDLSRAFLVALAATVALVMLFSGSLMAGLAVLPSLPEGLVRVVGGLAPATRPVLMGVLLACQASLAAWLAFGLARRAWLGTGPRWRSTLGESAALVGASLVAGVGQAMLMFAP